MGEWCRQNHQTGRAEKYPRGQANTFKEISHGGDGNDSDTHHRLG